MVVTLEYGNRTIRHKTEKFLKASHFAIHSHTYPNNSVDRRPITKDTVIEKSIERLPQLKIFKGHRKKPKGFKGRFYKRWFDRPIIQNESFISDFAKVLSYMDEEWIEQTITWIEAQEDMIPDHVYILGESESLVEVCEILKLDFTMLEDSRDYGKELLRKINDLER